LSPSRARIVTILIFVCVASFLLSIALGPTTMSLMGIRKSLGALFVRNELSQIVWGLRVPRSLMALATGASLAIAGALLQVVTRNPLASPYTFGVSSAAAFGAALAIVLGAGVTGWLGRVVYYTNPLLLVINALAFSIIVCAIVSLSSMAWGFSPTSTVLIGISMTFLFTAATSLVECFGTSEQIAAVVFWMFGDLSRSCSISIASTFATLALCTVLVTMLRRSLNALLAGEEVALSLGINVAHIRGVAIAAASLLVAVPTSFIGVIGFLGLIAPHIAKKLVGEEVGNLVMCSALIGASILCLADTLSRTVLSPLVIPVGITTSFLGVPLLLKVAVSRGRYVWS